MEVVDVPGDERVRQRLFNKYKESLRYTSAALARQLFKVMRVFSLSPQSCGGSDRQR